MDRVCRNVCKDPSQLYKSEAAKCCLEKIGKDLVVSVRYITGNLIHINIIIVVDILAAV